MFIKQIRNSLVRTDTNRKPDKQNDGHRQIQFTQDRQKHLDV